MPMRSVCSGWGPRLALAAAVVLIQTAWGGAMVPVPVPCNSATPVPAGSPIPFINAFRSCTAVMNGQTAVPATTTRPFPIPTVSSLPQIVYNRIQQQSDCAYQGLDLDVSQASAITVASCKGPQFGHPCSLVAHPFNNWNNETHQAETPSDFQSRACAPLPSSYVGITVTHGHCSLPQMTPSPAPSEEAALAAILAAPPYNLTAQQIEAMSPSQQDTLYATVSAANPNLVSTTQGSLANCVEITFDKQQGEAERQWHRGAWLQAMAFFTKQVLNEVSCNGQIQIDSDPAVDSCGSFAQAVQTQLQNAANIQQNVANLSGAKAAQDIDNCAADWTPPTTSGGVSTMDPGHLRQVSQHLCAARGYLEAEYAQLLTCEILQRTRNDYNLHLGLTEAQRQSTLMNNILYNNTDPWGMKSTNQCDYCRTQSNSYSEASGCMQKCYQKYIQQDLQLYYNNWWPLTKPATCPAPGKTPYSFPTSDASDVLGFAFLAGSLRRRKKSGGAKDLSKFRLIALIFVTAVIMSCSKAKSLPSVPTPSSSNVACPGGDPSCCPPAGAPSSWTAPANCLTDNPGGPGVTGTQVAGVGESGLSQGELGAANTLAGNGAGSGGGFSAESGVAAAPGSAAASNGGASTPSMGSLPSSNSGSNSGNSGGGGSGSGSSGLDGSGNTTTAAASPGPAISSGPDSVKAMEASYSSGGSGGGAGAKAKGGSGFLYGNGLVGGGAGGDGFGFGKTGGPAASGDPDPADYFQRIGYEADIFREVTKVYEDTSTKWAAQNASVPASNGMSDAGSATVGQPKAQPQPQK